MKRIFAAIAALGSAALAAPAPDYMMIRLSTEVGAPADVVWAKIGDFCFFGQLNQTKCEYLSGSGDVGTVRRLNGATVEAEIARTSRSYTYNQIEGARKDLDYHGTMAVEPATKGRSQIVYTLTLDQSRLPAGTNIMAMRALMATRFQTIIDRAKAMVESK